MPVPCENHVQGILSVERTQLIIRSLVEIGTISYGPVLDLRLVISQINVVRVQTVIGACVRQVVDDPRIVANRQLIVPFFPTADRSVFVESNRLLIVPLAVGYVCFWCAMGLLRLLPPSRVPSVGNRQRPHHGGTHARRIYRTPTCHYATS